MALSVSSPSIDRAGFEHFHGAMVRYWFLACMANVPGEDWAGWQKGDCVYTFELTDDIERLYQEASSSPTKHALLLP